MTQAVDEQLLQELAGWCDEEHQPLVLRFDRQAFLVTLCSLEAAQALVPFPGESGSIQRKVLRMMRDLVPDDVSGKARELSGQSTGPCECGRPLVGVDSLRTGRCEVCREDSGI